MKTLKQLLRIAPLLICAYAGSAQAMVINFIPTPGMDPVALAGFQQAANRWTNVLRDDITINLNINFSKLEPGVLGSTGSEGNFFSYQSVRDALKADAKGINDKKAVSSLAGGPCLSVMMNGTATNPNGAGSATPWVDNNCNDNNAFMYLNTANARALGLMAAHDSVADGSVEFSSEFAFDFDPSNGITKNTIDFVGVATHEIGHALGFVSGVDILDYYRADPYAESEFSYISTADLYRCSAESKAAGADLDWSADKRTKNFSLDRCNTALATFATGTDYGDGDQASHWTDGLGLGILDPTASYGELLAITQLDLTMFDVIGFDVAVPEPGSVALFLLGLGGLAAVRRRK